MTADLVSDEQLAEWEALAEAATEGPWHALSSGRAGGDHWYVCDQGESIALIHANDDRDEDQRQPDAEFIAAARSAVPLLVRALREARDENRRLHSQRRHLVAMLAKHSRYRAPAEDRFDCCAECNRGSVSYVPYPCQVRIDLEAALAAPTGQEGD